MDNYGFERGGYTPWAGYGYSKTANIYMANEIERHYGAQGLHGLSLMPGEISTGLQVHIPDKIRKQWSESVAVADYMKSPEQGALTTVYTALSRDWEGRGAKYLEDCDISHDSSQSETLSASYAVITTGATC